MYYVSAKVGSEVHMRAAAAQRRQYRVHITRPGLPDRLGCSDKLENIVPLGREVSADGAVCKRCAKFWARHT